MGVGQGSILRDFCYENWELCFGGLCQWDWIVPFYIYCELLKSVNWGVWGWTVLGKWMKKGQCKCWWSVLTGIVHDFNFEWEMSILSYFINKLTVYFITKSSTLMLLLWQKWMLKAKAKTSIIGHIVKFVGWKLLLFAFLPLLDVQIDASHQEQHEQAQNSFDASLQNVQSLRIYCIANKAYVKACITIILFRGDFNIGSGVSPHDNPTNNIQGNSQDEVPNNTISKKSYIPILWKLNLEFLDLILLNPMYEVIDQITFKTINPRDRYAKLAHVYW